MVIREYEGQMLLHLVIMTNAYYNIRDHLFNLVFVWGGGGGAIVLFGDGDCFKEKNKHKHSSPTPSS